VLRRTRRNKRFFLDADGSGKVVGGVELGHSRKRLGVDIVYIYVRLKTLAWHITNGKARWMAFELSFVYCPNLA
jgi:hypothetical protein